MGSVPSTRPGDAAAVAKPRDRRSIRLSFGSRCLASFRPEATPAISTTPRTSASLFRRLSPADDPPRAIWPTNAAPKIPIGSALVPFRNRKYVVANITAINGTTDGMRREGCAMPSTTTTGAKRLRERPAISNATMPDPRPVKRAVVTNALTEPLRPTANSRRPPTLTSVATTRTDTG